MNTLAPGNAAKAAAEKARGAAQLSPEEAEAWQIAWNADRSRRHTMQEEWERGVLRRLYLSDWAAYDHYRDARIDDFETPQHAALFELAIRYLRTVEQSGPRREVPPQEWRDALMIVGMLAPQDGPPGWFEYEYPEYAPLAGEVLRFEQIPLSYVLDIVADSRRDT